MEDDYEELKKVIYDILGSISPEWIIKKVERGEELSKEEKEIVLKFIHDETTNNKKVAKEALPKRREIGFKFDTLVGKIGGQKFAGFTHVSETIGNYRKDVKSNSKEILKGIRITSNNQTQENIKTLIKQHQASEEYLESYAHLLDTYKERISSDNQDFETPFAPEHQEAIKQAKIKVKELGTQYKKR